MKSTLRQRIEDVAHQTSLSAVVVSATGNTVAVRLPTGKVISGLSVIGGPVSVGDTVLVVYLNGTPYVLATTPQTSASAASGPTTVSSEPSASNPSSGTVGQHSIVGGEHTASGLTQNQALKATGVDSFAFGFISHDELVGVGPNDHHQAFVGLLDDAGASVDPDTNNKISIVGGQGLSTLSGSGSMQLDIDLDGASLQKGSSGLSIKLSSQSGLQIATDGLAIDDSVAGDGLLIASKVLGIDYGYGLGILAGKLIVDATPAPTTIEVLAGDGFGGIAPKYIELTPPPSISGIVLDQPGGQDAPAILINNNGVSAPAISILSGGLDRAEIFQGKELTIRSTGDLVVDAPSVLPWIDNAYNLGSPAKRWKSLYAAELIVDNLVAQSVMATIGGKIMVTPTTTLTRDFSPTDTIMYTKENPFAVNDYLYMSKNGQIEAMQVTAANGLTANGDYSYTVTRGLDSGATNNFALRTVNVIYGLGYSTMTLSGSTANSGKYWNTGDAVVSLQYTAGEGYIELTSTDTAHGYLGPQIVMQVRTATTNWNSSKPMLAIGNLDSYLDYSGTEFGFAVGNDLTLSPGSSFKGAALDRTNGLRLFNTPIKLYNSTLQTVDIQADGDVFFGEDISTAAKTSFVHLASAQTYNSESLGAGDILIGDNSSGKANVLWDRSAGKLLFRGGTTTEIEIGTDGKLYFASGLADISSDGIRINSPTGFNLNRGYRFFYGSDETAGLYHYFTGSLQHELHLRISSSTDRSSYMGISSTAPTNFDASIYIKAQSDTANPSITLFAESDASEPEYILLRSDSIKFRGQKWVFDGTSTYYGGYMFHATTPTDLIDTGNATWNGSLNGKGTGTYDFDHDLYNSWPSTVKAVLLFVGAKWATASVSNYANYRKNGGTTNEARIMSQANGMNDYAQVVVQCDTTGDFEVEIVGASADGCLVRLLGWYM